MIKKLDLVETNVCGPSPLLFFGGLMNYVTFIDDFTKKVWVYCFKDKFDAFACFQ